MEIITIVLIVVACILAALCIFLMVRSHATWSDEKRAVVIADLKQIASTVLEALRDGKVTMEEFKQIYDELLTLIADISGKTVSAVAADVELITPEKTAE